MIQREYIQKLFEISNALWKRDIMPRPDFEIGIFQRTERAMAKSICGVKLIDRKSTKDLMQMLGLNETIDQLVKVNSVRWYGHVLRKDKNNFLIRALDFKVRPSGKRGRPKKTWLRALVEQ